MASERKAYDDDKFAIGTDWQLTDFMRRVGLVFPLDESGSPTGETFYLKIRRQRPSSSSTVSAIAKPEPQAPKPSAKKPWWKFW